MSETLLALQNELADLVRSESAAIRGHFDELWSLPVAECIACGPHARNMSNTLPPP